MVNYTEKWKKGELKKAKYWVKYRNGNIDIWELSEGITIESKPEIIEVLAPVPSFEQWQSLNELLDSMRDTNKVLAHKIAPFTDPYFRGLTTKDIAELAKKSIRLCKQSCEDNTTIQNLKELLGYCADILEEWDDKDRDIEILLEEVDEALK